MTNKAPSPNARRTYDLAERTAKFGTAVVSFAGKIRKTTVSLPLISQLVRSGTSVGADYLEADEACSHKDFHHRITICRKEARETMHWLRMIVTAEPGTREDSRRLWKEAHELVLIFSTIAAKREKVK
jgi:four helix bundle protein